MGPCSQAKEEMTQDVDLNRFLVDALIHTLLSSPHQRSRDSMTSAHLEGASHAELQDTSMGTGGSASDLQEQERGQANMLLVRSEVLEEALHWSTWERRVTVDSC